MHRIAGNQRADSIGDARRNLFYDMIVTIFSPAADQIVLRG